MTVKMIFMKRCLIIFALVLLPLQFSWAAVSGYCQHETGVTAKHFGHHSHNHQSFDPQESSNEPVKLSSLDQDCAVCHFGCAVALLGNLTTSAVVSADTLYFLFFDRDLPTLSERPDRPQWSSLA